MALARVTGALSGRDTINRLLTPDITTVWVVGFLLLCTFMLNTLVFKPILAVIDSRAALDRDASNLAGAIVSRVLGRAN